MKGKRGFVPPKVNLSEKGRGGTNSTRLNREAEKSRWQAFKTVRLTRKGERETAGEGNDNLGP